MIKLKKWLGYVMENNKLEVGYALCSLGLVILCAFQMYALFTHNVSSFTLLIATVVIGIGLGRIEQYMDNGK